MNWETTGISLLEASLIRPFLLVAAAFLILCFWRVCHPASRHAVWTAVLIGMLVLPLATVLAPHWRVRILPPSQSSTESRPKSPVFISSELMGSTTGQARFPSSSKTFTSMEMFGLPTPKTLLVWCYLVGLFGMFIYRAIGWVLLCRIVSRSRPLTHRLRESPDVITPLAAGILRPVVILPAEWRTWSASTKRAVLAHELAHIRRHDPLITALGRVVKSVFWFHPLAWWISRQVSQLAELACDAAALEKLNDPAEYSRILLRFAEAVNLAGHRVALPGLAMADTSEMGRRLDQVFELAMTSPRKIPRPKVMLPLMGVPVLCLAATAGLGEHTVVTSSATVAALVRPDVMKEPILRAQIAPVFNMRPQRTLKPQENLPTQSTTSTKPTFEVVSVKPCRDALPPGGRSGGGTSTSGRLVEICITVKSLIVEAYVLFADGQRQPSSFLKLLPVEGGPSWIDSERFTVEAKASTPSNVETMRGPMLQALLEDRFGLKIHRGIREVPVYNLMVAKSGLKVQTAEDGSCTPRDLTTSPGQRLQPGQKPFCGTAKLVAKRGLNFTWDVHAMTFDEFSKWLNLGMDYRVIDKTGISGKYDFRLEFASDENTPGLVPGGDRIAAVDADTSTPASPSIFAALQSIGLRLERSKGPGEYLVIDHVEKPSEN